MKSYIIRDAEAGNYITDATSYEEAEKIIKQFEEEDRADDNYSDNAYEIVVADENSANEDEVHYFDLYKNHLV